MNIGKYKFDFEQKPVIMGILNVTPDSFSDGGMHNDIDSILSHTEMMISEGAEIIDVGGESTRPGYTFVEEAEEIERIVPAIEAIKNRFDVAVSLDTYKAGVAEAGIKAGCDLINDIWGLKISDVLREQYPEYDKNNPKVTGYPDNANVKLAKLVASKNVPICIMHNRDYPKYNDFVSDVISDLKESVEIAMKAGISNDNIILDPGVGFGKTYEHNLEIIKEVNQIVDLGYPVLLGTSRKSVVGLALDVPKDDRVAGTVATTVMGLERGCRIFRVHDIKANYQAMMMAWKIIKGDKG